MRQLPQAAAAAKAGWFRRLRIPIFGAPGRPINLMEHGDFLRDFTVAHGDSNGDSMGIMGFRMKGNQLTIETGDSMVIWWDFVGF